MTEQAVTTYARYFQDTLGLQVVPLFAPTFGVAGGLCRCREGADCTSPGKHPKGRFKGQPSRLPTKYENYAVVLGRYVVVDVDDRSILDTLPEVLGFALPETWAVDTGKGRHYWFQHTEPLATRLGAFPKVDLKSGNTYVVGPGSVSITGTFYEPINELPIAPAPEDLVVACGRQRVQLDVPVTHSIPKTTSRFGLPTVEQWCAEMRDTSTRNNTLLRLSCLMMRSGWAGEDALVMLALAAEEAGLGAYEIERTMDSARRMVMGG